MTQACIDKECQNPCPFERCGVNAECSVRNHRPKCICLPDHIGNPYDKCRRPECLTDPDCHTTLTCKNEKCVDPCDCARNAECNPRNHRGICKCIPDYTGDPYGIACTPSKIISFLALLTVFCILKMCSKQAPNITNKKRLRFDSLPKQFQIESKKGDDKSYTSTGCFPFT